MTATLVGCAGPKPVYFDGKSATYEHQDGAFAQAMLDAKQQCETSGKLIKHDSTACSFGAFRKCVSTFSCIDK